MALLVSLIQNNNLLGEFSLYNAYMQITNIKIAYSQK